MKRRPHWDDALITAVCATGDDGEVDYWMTSDQVYRIIAAVEDWHEKFVMHGAFRVLAERAASAEADRDRLANQLLNEVPDSYIQMKARALTAEAAIQRVRELHHPIPGFNGTQWCGAHCEATADGDPTEYPCETIRALDGGAE